MKCYEGHILTVNQNNDVARYLVEDGGKIVYVGNDLPEQYHSAEVIQLGEKALIPAFVDTHQHFASFSTFHAGLNVMDAASNAEIMEMVKQFAAQSPKKTLIAFGASPYCVKEGRLISRQELDAVCPDKEIMVVKYDGHACIVNSRLLNAMESKVKHLRGYHPDTGEMNQEAFFAFSNALTNSLSIPELIHNMQSAVDFQASRGIGCVHTVSGVGFAGDLDITLEKLFAKGLKNGFQIRVFPQSMNVKTATSRHLPRIGGCFACALDGCFGSHDAALHAPYADEIGGEGVLYYDDQKVMDFCKEANRAGLQIELHAIGDKAFDQACRAIKAALDDYPREDHRHGIIHDCLPTPEGIANLPGLSHPDAHAERVHRLEAGTGRLSGTHSGSRPPGKAEPHPHVPGQWYYGILRLRRPLHHPRPNRLDGQGGEQRQRRSGGLRSGRSADVYLQRRMGGL